MQWSDISGGTWLADAWVPDLTSDTAVQTPALFKATMQLSIKAGAQILRADTAAGITLCRDIAGKRQVWGTIGPSGKIMKLREVEEDELQQLFEERAALLVEAKPDALILEALADLEEATVALRGLKKVSHCPVGVTLMFGSGSDSTDTIMGQTCEESADLLTAQGADLVGCHGGQDIDRMVLVVRLIRQRSKLPIMACPEAGQRELDKEAIVFREGPDQFASKVDSLIAAGANVVGGAAGVSPEHIKAVSAVLRQSDNS
jgi:5-methyltetrahydrofolate--homocysteine methyltransferase